MDASPPGKWPDAVSPCLMRTPRTLSNHKCCGQVPMITSVLPQMPGTDETLLLHCSNHFYHDNAPVKLRLRNQLGTQCLEVHIASKESYASLLRALPLLSFLLCLGFISGLLFKKQKTTKKMGLPRFYAFVFLWSAFSVVYFRVSLQELLSVIS